MLTKIRDAGFENVMLDQEGTRNLRRFITVAHETGLKVPFVHLDSTSASSIWTTCESQKDFLKYIDDSIKICGDGGVETVVMHPSYAATGCAPSQIGVDCMEHLLRTASAHNVKIALENPGKEHLPHLAYLMNNIDSKNLGFCFDSGHWNLSPDVDLLELYGDRLIAVHLHDNLGVQSGLSRYWDQDMHQIPFDGSIDFDRIAQGIAKTNYNGPVMLESRRSEKNGSRYLGMPPKDFLENAQTKARRLAGMISHYKSSARCF